MIDFNDYRQYLTVKAGLDETSIVARVIALKTFFKYINDRPLTPQLVEDYFYHLKTSKKRPGTINNYLSSLHHFENYCASRNLPYTNITEGIRPSKPVQSPIETLSEGEIDQLIHVDVPYGHCRYATSEETTTQNKELYSDLILFLSRTGARIEEAQTLKVKNVDLADHKVTFADTKNKTYRSVWFTEPLVECLRKRILNKNREDYIFTGLQGTMIDQKRFNAYLHKAAQICHITKRVHAHLFRHSFASLLYRATKDIGLVQIVLGHKDIKSTMVYIHIADEAIKSGINRHPFNIKSVSAEEYVNEVKKAIEQFKLENHPKFNKLKVYEATSRFILSLYEAAMCLILCSTFPGSILAH